ncbi:Protein Rf1, mitochondrial [Symbiodinium microadriaticum]|uniref:Protein Rf1, mitochondrial n=1 Tax=Symbiodinium microadriaticum TaxID=2951 RepID=A0A1Q9D658_SYMMI|nr:Protein Rf1, mitochondrial [Symbiodinium microadriaticum]
MIASGACLSRDIKAACLGIYVRVALQATSLGALTQDTSQVRRRRANSCVTAGEWSRPDMGKAQADAAFEECCGTCRLPTSAALLCKLGREDCSRKSLPPEYWLEDDCARTGGTKLADVRWRGVLSKYKLDGWQTAASIFRAMLKLLVEPDATHHNAVLSACVVGRGWQQSGAVFEGMSQQSLEPDIVSLTTLAGLATRGSWVSALNLLSFTRELQVDRIICCEVLKSYKKSSKWTLSLRSLARMSESYLRIDSVSCSHFMNTTSRWLVALQAISWFQLPQGKAGLLPFNILQNSYSSTEWESAAAGLDHACHSRLCPDEISFCVSLKKQCWLLVAGAFALLHKMLSQEVRPNINCYNCLVHVSSSNWPVVLKILLCVQQQLILPDTVTLNTCVGSIGAASGNTWALPLVLVEAAGVQRATIRTLHQRCDEVLQESWALEAFTEPVVSFRRSERLHCVQYSYGYLRSCVLLADGAISYRSLHASHFAPDDISFNTAISSCEKGETANSGSVDSPSGGNCLAVWFKQVDNGDMERSIHPGSHYRHLNTVWQSIADTGIYDMVAAESSGGAAAQALRALRRAAQLHTERRGTVTAKPGKIVQSAPRAIRGRGTGAAQTDVASQHSQLSATQPASQLPLSQSETVPGWEQFGSQREAWASMSTQTPSHFPPSSTDASQHGSQDGRDCPASCQWVFKSASRVTPTYFGVGAVGVGAASACLSRHGASLWSRTTCADAEKRPAWQHPPPAVPTMKERWNGKSPAREKGPSFWRSHGNGQGRYASTRGAKEDHLARSGTPRASFAEAPSDAVPSSMLSETLSSQRLPGRSLEEQTERASCLQAVGLAVTQGPVATAMVLSASCSSYDHGVSTKMASAITAEAADRASLPCVSLTAFVAPVAARSDTTVFVVRFAKSCRIPRCEWAGSRRWKLMLVTQGNMH